LTFRFPRFKTFRESAVVPFQDGAELFRLISTDRDVKVQQEMSFDIAFNEPGIVDAEPVIPTLHELLSFTTSTFDAFLMRFFSDGVEGAHQAEPPAAP
jgi:hypothetical protein